MNKVKKGLTEELREMTRYIKSKLVEKYGRPPKLASYYIYKAIIENDLTSTEDIILYLNQNGIKMDFNYK